MTPEQKINAILSEFAVELGLEPAGLVLDGEYACLAVDKAAVLHLKLLPESAALDLFMELGPVPPAVRQAVCEVMLQANVLFQATEGAALGFDRERGIAVATLRLDVDGLTAARFKDRVERFLIMTEFWAKRIGGVPEAAPEPGFNAFLRV